MSRLLFPLSLSLGAFAAAWWAGVLMTPPAPAPSPVGGSGSGAASPETAASAVMDRALPRAGFARREAVLLREETTDPREIRRILESGTTDSGGEVSLCRTWADQDPAGFWKWLENGGRKRLGIGVESMVFEAWFRKDSAAALAAFRGADAKYRSQAASGLLGVLLDNDETLRGKLLPYLDEIVAAGAFRIESMVAGAETVAMLEKLPPGSGRDTLLQSAASDWMNSDWKGASTWADGLAEPLKSKIMAELMNATFNPSRRYFSADQKSPSYAESGRFEWARQWFTKEASADVKRKLGPRFVSTLAVGDPAAALEWAQDNLGGQPLTQAVGKVLEQQSKKDPAAARAVVEELPPGGVKQSAAFAAVGTPTAESMTWLLSQTDKGTVREWYQIASKWAFSDPDGYKKYLETADTASLPSYLVNGGIDNLIRKDGPGTLDWALSTQTPQTAGTALKNWSEQNAPAAAAWLKDHVTSAWDSKNVNALAGGYFAKSPAEAVDWAVSLPPGQVRDTSLSFLRKSLTENSTLPVEQRTSLEARLGKP